MRREPVARVHERSDSRLAEMDPGRENHSRVYRARDNHATPSADRSRPRVIQPTHHAQSFGAPVEVANMNIVIGPVLRRADRYAFNTWTAGKGVTRSYPYHRIDQAYYAQNAEIKASAQSRATTAIVCQTLDEFIVKLTGDGYPVDNAYLAAGNPWLQRQLHTPVGLGDRPFVVGRRPVPGEGLPPREPDLMLDDSRPFRLSRNHFVIEQRREG